MERYCVLGHPIAHSLSPQLHNRWFRRLGMEAEYGRFDTPVEELPQRVAWLCEQNYRGWNLTLPLKLYIQEYLQEIDSEAQMTGSVNTVLNRDGKLFGTTTDGFGLEQALLQAFDLPVQGGKLLFLGAGGAVRSTSITCALHGASRISIANRTLERAECLAQDIHRIAPQCQVEAIALAEEKKVIAAAEESQVLIQGTSLELNLPQGIPLDLHKLPPPLPIMDMIYGETRFLQLAQKLGHPVCDGMPMLVYQGAKSFELWTGQKPPLD